jgi:hypothetical protein
MLARLRTPCNDLRLALVYRLFAKQGASKILTTSTDDTRTVLSGLGTEVQTGPCCQTTALPTFKRKGWITLKGNKYAFKA